MNQRRNLYEEEPVEIIATGQANEYVPTYDNANSGYNPTPEVGADTNYNYSTPVESR
jgi:hypothetical protein